MSDFVKKEDAIRICKMCASLKYRVPYIEQAFENIPTIDAVSVVRCKDCKHNPKYTDDYMYGRCVFCCEDDFYSGTPDDDFYCGYGERKGE